MVVVEVNGHTIEPGADLSGANLKEADLSQAGFFRAYLRAVFSLSWDLIKRTLRISPADLSGANLEGADLSGANLSGANFGGANLARAKADAKTTWPEGFDPKAAGVTFT